MLRYKKTKKISIQQVLFFMNLVIFVGCAIYLGNYYFQGYKSESKIDDLRQKMESCTSSVLKYSDKDTDKTSIDNDSSGRQMLQAYADARQSDYPYLVGRIKIENTPIDYFVMQTPDEPEYFLRRDVTGADNNEGTPFVDVNCNLSLPSNNIMIYAHAMKNQHQFGSLRKYKNESYYKEHPTVLFESMYETMCEYDIVAAFYARVYDETDVDVFRYYYFFGCDNERDFDYYIDNIRGLSCYDTGIIPVYGDQLITLSTCNNEQHDTDYGRFVVVARKRTTENASEVLKDTEDNTEVYSTSEPATQESTELQEPIETEESGELTYEELIQSLNTDEPVVTSEPTPTPEPVVQEPEVSESSEDNNYNSESVNEIVDGDLTIDSDLMVISAE